MHEFSCENAEGNVIAIRNRAELEISRQTTRVRSIFGIDSAEKISSRLNHQFADTRGILYRVDHHRRFFEFRVNRQPDDLEARPPLIIRVASKFSSSVLVLQRRFRSKRKRNPKKGSHNDTKPF